MTIKKKLMQPQGGDSSEKAALQEKAALKAVKQTLKLTFAPHHITRLLDCYRHCDPTYGLDFMYFITK